jgi:methylglutaconyl-CoA hydratase
MRFTLIFLLETFPFNLIMFPCLEFTFFLAGETSGMAINFYETLKQFPKPIVARINGPALGGGWGLLFCTDIRVSVASSWFSFAEVKRGIVPAIISAFVVPELGPFQSRKLFLTGEKISSQKGKELGFLNDVVADEAELNKIVDAYVKQLLENGPKAMKMVKTLVAHNTDNTHHENLNFVKGIFEKYVVTSKEAKYGMEMFAKKQTPDWSSFYSSKL